MDALIHAPTVVTRIACLAACASVSITVSAKDVSSMYTSEELQSWKARYSENIDWNYKNVILPLLSREERIAVRDVKLSYPLTDTQVGPFSIGTKPGGKEIAIPIHTVRFLDELAIAYAWLTVKRKTTPASVFTYVARLKYTTPETWPDHRYLPPMKALMIPSNVLKDGAVDKVAQDLLKAQIVYLISREIGGLVLTYPGGDWASPSGAQNESFTIQADSFGLEILRRLAVPPINLCFYLQAELRLTPYSSDFPREDQYRRYIGSAASGAITDKRLYNIANQMVRAKSEFTRAQSSPASWENRVATCAGLLVSESRILKDPAAQNLVKEQARSISLEDLRPH